MIGFRARVELVGIRRGKWAEGEGLRGTGLRVYSRVKGAGCRV